MRAGMYRRGYVSYMQMFAVYKAYAIRLIIAVSDFIWWHFNNCLKTYSGLMIYGQRWTQFCEFEK